MSADTVIETPSPREGIERLLEVTDEDSDPAKRKVAKGEIGIEINYALRLGQRQLETAGNKMAGKQCIVRVGIPVVEGHGSLCGLA